MADLSCARRRAWLLALTALLLSALTTVSAAKQEASTASDVDANTPAVDANAADANAVKYFTRPEDGWPKDPNTGFIKKVYLRAKSGKALHKRAWFHLSVPDSYTPKKAWPLVVVLHGGPGGKPDQITGFYKGGLSQMGAISVYPMAMTDQLLDWNYPHSGAYILSIIKQVAREYRIDPRRLYLTGVSMGGGGSWVQGALGREVWAAIGPVSGWYGASHSPDAKLLKDMPVYFLHGRKDRHVPAVLSHRAAAALKRIGRDVKVFKERPDANDIADANCVYREIQNAKHNCFLPWKKSGAPELGLMMSWMLSHKRSEPADLDKGLQRIADHGEKFGWTPEGSPIGQYGREQKEPKRRDKRRKPDDGRRTDEDGQPEETEDDEPQ